MDKLTTDNWYDKINHCIVCWQKTIIKESFDNHTMVQVNCLSCNNEFTISLYDNED